MFDVEMESIWRLVARLMSCPRALGREFEERWLVGCGMSKNGGLWELLLDGRCLAGETPELRLVALASVPVQGDRLVQGSVSGCRSDAEPVFPSMTSGPVLGNAFFSVTALSVQFAVHRWVSASIIPRFLDLSRDAEPTADPIDPLLQIFPMAQPLPVVGRCEPRATFCGYGSSTLALGPTVVGSPRREVRVCCPVSILHRNYPLQYIAYSSSHVHRLSRKAGDHSATELQVRLNEFDDEVMQRGCRDKSVEANFMKRIG